MCRRKQSIAGLIALVALMAAVLAGCGSSSSSSTDGTEAQASGGPDGKSIYLVTSGDVNPWLKIHNHTVIDDLEAEGAEVTYLEDPFNPQVQAENLNRAVAAEPDLILVGGLDYRSLVPGLERAKAAGIPVINVGSDPRPANEFFVKSIEGNHEELGEMAAENVIEGLQEQGTTSGNVIAITGTSSLNQVTDRMEGFKKVLASEPGLKLVAEEDGNWDQATSQKIAQQLFAQFRSKGGIQAAYGMADNQALGIIQAAKEAGLKVGGKDGLIVVGGNCYKAGLEAIEAGEEYGTATYSPSVVGQFVSEKVTDWLEGKKIPDRSLTTEERITKDNVQQVLDEGICP